MKIIGHRGAKGLAPENTLDSIAHALKHHVDEVEVDVRVTKDLVPVLCHDDSIHIGDESLVIADTTLAVLHKHRPDLATLSGAFSFIDAQCSLHIEVKPGEPIEPIAVVLQHWLDTGMYHERNILLASKNQQTLVALHKAFPVIEKVVIENWSGTRAYFRAKAVGAKRLSMLDVWLWSGFIRSMTRRGYEIYCFPATTNRKQRFFRHLGLGGHCNDPERARRWTPSGLAGVITDYPDLFDK